MAISVMLLMVGILGVFTGIGISQWWWSRLLREKADNGFRLAHRGSLYVVRHPLKPSDVDRICERCRRELEDAADINKGGP